MGIAIKNKHYILGFIASILMFTTYFGVMLIFNPLVYVIEDLISKFVLISLIVVSFGIQVGLFTYIRNFNKLSSLSRGQTAMSGGVSSTSMLVCCLHHVTELIPLIGISAFTIFLVKYQLLFLYIGVLFSILSIINLVLHIKKYHLFNDKSILNNFSEVTFLRYRNIYVIVSSLIIGLYSVTIIIDILRGGVV